MNQIEQIKKIRNTLTRFLMMYKFALDELETRIDILKEEFQLLHDYNPIEHTKSRLKSPESIMGKVMRKGAGGSLAGIRQSITDIAGMRITCSFISDIYRIRDMLHNQNDLKIVQTKDYIREPKPNGYRSLHLIVQVPVHMSDRREMVDVEVQIRTIAMDFWASLEHKIYYKYEGSVPQHLLNEMKDAADTAAALDARMEAIQTEVETVKLMQEADVDNGLKLTLFNNEKLEIPAALLELVQEDSGPDERKRT